MLAGACGGEATRLEMNPNERGRARRRRLEPLHGVGISWVRRIHAHDGAARLLDGGAELVRERRGLRRRRVRHEEHSIDDDGRGKRGIRDLRIVLEGGRLTALGDAVNSAARLSSAAGPHEVLVSVASADAGGLDRTGLEVRHLELKGRTEPMDVVVLAAGS